MVIIIIIFMHSKLIMNTKSEGHLNYFRSTFRSKSKYGTYPLDVCFVQSKIKCFILLTHFIWVFTGVMASNETVDYELPIDVTIVTIEPYNPNLWFGLPLTEPIMEMAVEHVNTLYEGRIRFHLVTANGSCSRDVVGVSAAEISCSNNISVFIGTSKYNIIKMPLQ